MRRRVVSNRLFPAALAGTLVWLADQPTVGGYQPMAQMFWDPGIWRLPLRDVAALSLSWIAATIFCHFLWFSMQLIRGRQRAGVKGIRGTHTGRD